MSAGIGALSLVERNRLAAGTRREVAQVGGVETAADIIGKSKSQIGRMQSPHDPDCLTLADAVAMARASVATPDHAAALRVAAQLAGGVFIALPDSGEGAGDMAMRLAAMMAEAGGLCAAGGAALADDGFIDAREATALLDNLDKVTRATAAMGETLRAIIAGERA